jgi:hypothetical protein
MPVAVINQQIFDQQQRVLIGRGAGEMSASGFQASVMRTPPGGASCFSNRE